MKLIKIQEKLRVKEALREQEDKTVSTVAAGIFWLGWLASMGTLGLVSVAAVLIIISLGRHMFAH